MAISAKQVKELRESTGAGMLDCKKALEIANGDLDKAVDVLREKGLGKAAKKMDRLANEGTISLSVSDDYKTSTLLEVNTETDFVAKNEGFQTLVKDISNLIQKENPKDLEALKLLTLHGINFQEYLNSQIAKIGENIVVRRFVNIICEDKETTNGYLHVNGRVGVILKVDSSCNASENGVDELLKNISMHAAAMSPRFLKAEDIPQEELDKEEHFHKEELRKLNKPEKIWGKILEGKAIKYKDENTLFGQYYVMDNRSKILDFINAFAKKANIDLKITDYIRFELGEGLDKKSEDFADEVAKVLN